jgi:hypothetical protein
MNYFDSTKLYSAFQKKRGEYLEITIDKDNGDERVLAGVLCFSEKSKVYYINEGESVKDFCPKMIKLNRVKRIVNNGVSYSPKQNG